MFNPIRNFVYKLDRIIHGTNEDGSINKKNLTVSGILLSILMVAFGIVNLNTISTTGLQQAIDGSWIHFIINTYFWIVAIVSITYIIMAFGYLFYMSKVKEKRPLKDYVGTGQEHVLLPRSEYKLGELVFMVSLLFHISTIGFAVVASVLMVTTLVEGFFNDNIVHDEDKRIENKGDQNG